MGGGNVAMDAARCAKRLGAEEVYIVYRRGMDELPARKEEVEHAEEEGIIFKTLTNPVEVLGDENGCVNGMTCAEMELGEPDASGRRRPIVKEGSEFVLDVDSVIMAIGTSPNPLIRHYHAGPGNRKQGCIVATMSTASPDQATAYMPAATLLPAQLPSFWLWAPVRKLPRPYLHPGKGAVDGKRIQELNRRIRELNPDMILFTGDIFDEHVERPDFDSFNAFFATLDPPGGKWFVLGNHDLFHHWREPSYGRADLEGAFARAHIRILEDVSQLAYVGKRYPSAHCGPQGLAVHPG